MLNQFLTQMDRYLSNKPFKRRWWFGRPWSVYITELEPALSKDKPLWKRSPDQLRLLRLFDLSPRELGKKIERYWKKPRWRRWFASFGMKKKIDVWNYYQRCVAYQSVRPDKLEAASGVMTSESGRLLNELACVLHQYTMQFEARLEKRCGHPRGIEQHFSDATKGYQQELEKIFSSQLAHYLRRIETATERLAIKQEAEQGYQQAEALMYKYLKDRFEKRLNGFFSSSPQLPVKQRLSGLFSRYSQVDLAPRLDVQASLALQLEMSVIQQEVAQEENRASPERSRLAVYTYAQTVPASFRSSLPSKVVRQTGVLSLQGAKSWIKTQEERLHTLIEEGSLAKVERLLDSSLNEIKEITEFYLNCYDITLSPIRGQPDKDIDYLNNLQGQLKSLLRGGMLLFHSDRVMHVRQTDTMTALVTSYTQRYLDQSRYYLDKLKGYHERIGARYPHLYGDWADLAQGVQELEDSINAWEASLKEFDKQHKESVDQLRKALEDSEAKRLKDKEDSEAKRLKDKEDSRVSMRSLMKELLAAERESQSAGQSALTAGAEVQDAQVESESHQVGFFK